MAATSLNKNNSAVKRIMQEAKELANDPCTDYSAAPLEDDIFEWHCTLRGPAGTDFEGGLYHFRILLPAEYPFRPPSLMMLTPNGRFELNTKICVSFTSYHEELWQPAWGVRTAILGLQGFFPLKGQQAVGVGSVEYPSGERKRLAALSREWVCPHCQESNISLLPDADKTSGEDERVAEVKSEPPVSEPCCPTVESASAEHSQTSETLKTDQVENASSESADTDLPSGSTSEGQEPVGSEADVRPVIVTEQGRISGKPAVAIVDGAICVLVAMVFAIVYYRV